MAPFLKSLLSSDYRRALAAEAAGDYLEAARAYALAGERVRVGEMHLLLAERASAPDTRLAELRAALRWADDESAAARSVRGRAGLALLAHVRGLGALSERDTGLLREAAALLIESGHHLAAGECQELLGDDARAAESYQQAGDLDRLEAVLSREERRGLRAGGLRDALDEYQLHLALGERDAAIARLEDCVALDPGGAHARLLADLRARRIGDGRVAIAVDEEPPVQHAGVFPVELGRDPAGALALRDACVSRRHAAIREEGGRFFVRDERSRNGTRLRGLRIDHELPLEGRGELDLGDDCTVGFEISGDRLRLDVLRGLDRGRGLVASPSPIDLTPFARLRFDRGRPLVEANAGSTVRLDGVRAPRAVQLVRGDRVDLLDEAGVTRARLRVER